MLNYKHKTARVANTQDSIRRVPLVDWPPRPHICHHILEALGETEGKLQKIKRSSSFKRPWHKTLVFFGKKWCHRLINPRSFLHKERTMEAAPNRVVSCLIGWAKCFRWAAEDLEQVILSERPYCLFSLHLMRWQLETKSIISHFFLKPVSCAFNPTVCL